MGSISVEGFYKSLGLTVVTAFKGFQGLWGFAGFCFQVL